MPAFGNGPADENGYLLQRYMIHFDLRAGGHVRLFTEFKGNIENDRNGGPRPDIDEDLGDLHQAFTDIRLVHVGSGTMSVRVGRQEMTYGSGRFMDIREGPNVRQSFEGARLTYCSAPWRVDGFATRPVLNSNGAFNDVANHQTGFWGLYATHLFHTQSKLGIDFYYFGLDQKQSHYARATAREQRLTLGSRVFGGKAGWAHDYEAAGQSGRFGNGGIRARTIASNTGYQFEGASWRPRIGAKFNIASGDSGLPGHPLGSLNPLFASLHYFGEEGLAGPVNFYDVRPETSLHPRKNVRVSLDSDWFWRQNIHDGIYLPGPVLLVAPKGSTLRYSGNKSALEIEWDPSPHLLFTTYYSHFQNGGFVSQASKTGNLDYAAGWMTYQF